MFYSIKQIKLVQFTKKKHYLRTLSTIIKENHQFHGIKNIRRGHPKDWEKSFPLPKTSNTKNAGNVSELFFEIHWKIA